MPTMFDSHDEFNEWFSRDIESHAEKKGGLDENQLSRLHMILKPFMLRRIKRDVEHEMAEKVELNSYSVLMSVYLPLILSLYYFAMCVYTVGVVGNADLKGCCDRLHLLCTCV